MGIKEWLIEKAVKDWLEKQRKGNTAMWKFLDGKKSFLIAGATAVLGSIATINQVCSTDPANAICIANVHLPSWIFIVLGALGIGARAVTSKPGFLVKPAGQ